MGCCNSYYLASPDTPDEPPPPYAHDVQHMDTAASPAIRDTNIDTASRKDACTPSKKYVSTKLDTKTSKIFMKDGQYMVSNGQGSRVVDMDAIRARMSRINSDR